MKNMKIGRTVGQNKYSLLFITTSFVDSAGNGGIENQNVSLLSLENRRFPVLRSRSDYLWDDVTITT